MQRKFSDYLWLTLKGMGMGAADVVPGVSGGTIAFIVGIYDELIESIKGINLQVIKFFFTGRFKEFWKLVNGNFLLSLLLGICISVFSLARVITLLLDEQPVYVWSFFFGLVLASTWFVARDVKERNWKTLLGFVCGAVVAYLITVATPAEPSTHPLFVFVCGAVAICAMILPGISGSFILVLMGMYKHIMEAVKGLDLITLALFAAGALVGITTFSRVLSYALRHFRNLTLAVLSGFMLGSLNKVWPWKTTMVQVYGGQEFKVEHNVLPHTDMWSGIALMVLGFVLVYALEKVSSHKS